MMFSFEFGGKSPARFEVSDRRLALDPPEDARLGAPTTNAPGLDIQDWQDGKKATLNRQPLTLGRYEASFTVAIAPDQQSFVLGTPLSLYRFDRAGKQIWRVPMPDSAYGVNVPSRGKIIVTALGDGTIRWYRLSDGKELLGFFPHADRKRWVLWSPSGYYDAAPGAEDLIGWHVNRGKDSAADFYPVSRFRATFYRPDVLAKVLDTGDQEAAAVRLANQTAGRQILTEDVANALPPVVEILSPVEGAAVSTADVRVRFLVRTAPDAPITGLRARVNGQAVRLPEATNIAIESKPEATRELAIPIPPHDSEVMLFAENRHGVAHGRPWCA